VSDARGSLKTSTQLQQRLLADYDVLNLENGAQQIHLEAIDWLVRCHRAAGVVEVASAAHRVAAQRTPAASPLIGVRDDEPSTAE